MLMESGFWVSECGWVRVTQGDTGWVSKGNELTYMLWGRVGHAPKPTAGEGVAWVCDVVKFNKLT
jgi:hypothetical protein